MPRWEAHVRQRLELAALDLYASQGYDRTTVGDIAGHVGVTPRTYFRYFPDKREVLFAYADQLRDQIATSLRDAPAGMPPLAASLHAMATCEPMFHAREHEYLRRRDAVVATSADLQEREARKLATIASVMTDVLVERGAVPPVAQLVADLAVVAFKHASRLWRDEPTTSYAEHLHAAAAQASDLLSPETSGTATA